MVKVQIILGSTRPNRNGQAVAEWVYENAKRRPDLEVGLLDVAEFALPLLDEPLPPMAGQYTKEHTKRWADKIAQADGYIFVTGEYNHGIPGAPKNAIDYLYAEWTNKAAGFVSYGTSGGALAVEHLRGVMAELQIADVRAQLLLSLSTDFETADIHRIFRPTQQHARRLQMVIDQVVSWSAALRTIRAK
ncbi:MAG: NADPH-dependent FMN reductase [Chloroflexota bacterium]